MNTKQRFNPLFYQLEFMYFIRTDIQNQNYPGKDELARQIMAEEVTHYEDIDPKLFSSWAPPQLFDTRKKYSPWLFVLKNDLSLKINSDGSLSGRVRTKVT